MQQTAQRDKSLNARKGKSYSISNRVDLSPSQPIPFESNSAAFSYLNNTRYIPFLVTGDANSDQYGRMLLEARLTSTTHNSCITTKKDYCAGDGFRNKKGQDLDLVFSDWLSNLNVKNENATELNKQTFESFFTFGNCPVELARFSVAGKKYFYIYVHNFLKWRLLKPENGIVTGAITSPLFLRQNNFILDEHLKEAKLLPLYNPLNSDRQNWAMFPDGTERTMLWYKHAVSGFEHYGLPSSVSSMIYQILEYKGARYNLDNFENNMVVSAILALKGSISPAEATRIAKAAISTHTGDGKRGRVMVLASEEGIDDSSLHSLETQKDSSYAVGDGIWTSKIIHANQWDAVLAGIVSSNTFGKGSGFITKIKEHINNTVITPAQQDIYGKVWKHVFKLAKEWMGFNIDENELEINNTIDISGLTDIDITPAIQVNEARTSKGLAEDPKMQGVYMGAAKSQQQNNSNSNMGGDNVQP